MSKHLILVLSIVILCSGCALLSKQTTSLTPDQTLALVRNQLVGISHDVETAHVQNLIDETQYASAKSGVLKAVHEYNIVFEKYKILGSFSQTELDRVIALIAAVASSIQRPS